MGGTEQIDKVFHLLIIDLRKRINIEFENIKNNYCINYFIVVNGEIVKYHDVSGIHRIVFLKKKNEIRLDVCFAEISIGITCSQALEMIREQFLKSIEGISDLVRKKKIDLQIDTISSSFNKIFDNMKIQDVYLV